MSAPRPWRDTVFVEDATVLAHDHCAGDQHVLRLEAPKTARAARPGSFVHLRCDAALPMRRPMSIMRASPAARWIDVLYKVHGCGTALLARRQPGERLSLMGPIGTPFKGRDYLRRPLLIGGGVGIPPMVFLAEHLRGAAPQARPLVLMGSEIPFPFNARPSTLLVDGLPAGVIAAMPLLEDWGIASRLTSARGFPGCYPGLVTELARAWLSGLDDDARRQVEVFACGPTPMLEAVQALAAEFALPAQLSLEEYMACAIGGCAGCAVAVRSGDRVAMKRVCVDGPVFDAASVIFPSP